MEALLASLGERLDPAVLWGLALVWSGRIIKKALEDDGLSIHFPQRDARLINQS